MKQFLIGLFVLAMAGMNMTQTRAQDSKCHKSRSDRDTSKVIMQGITVKKIGKDSMIVYVRTKEIKDWHNWPPNPFCKKGKFNGHWAGVELGINGYVNEDFNMNFYPKYPYLNMNTARSLMVNLNPIDFSVNIYRNKIGFTSGIGFQLSNYYFTGNYVWVKDSAQLVAYQVQDTKGNWVSLKQNKLFICYFNIPLFFEFQTNSGRKLNSFHVTLGVVGGIRLGSYSKQIYSNVDQNYYLVKEDGTKIAGYYVDDNVVRNHGAYHLNPFKLDAAFRIGWSHLNLFATYSLTPMFQENQGPKIYPWTMGITLLGW